MPEPVVAVAGLTKRYGERLALDDVDLEISAGEVFGLLGPNGAGKTTLLRIVAGLMRPTTGRVTVCGSPAASAAAMADTGTLIEAPAAYPYLSGRENLKVFARYAHVHRSRVEAALATVELTERGDDRVATYSFGMKQRLGVAIALLKQPAVLILDEPTNGLDPAGIADMRRLVRALGSDGRTVVVSSHVLPEIELTCDRLAVLARGRLVHSDKVDDLLSRRPLRVDAEPREQAAELLRSRVGAEHVEVVSDGVLVQTDRDAVAGLNRELVLAGVRVQELAWDERSLERVFLRVTSAAEAESAPTLDGQVA